MKQKRSIKRTTRRILTHPITIWGLLVAGVIIAGLTLISSADSYILTATVPAPALTEAAYITSPLDNAVITSIPTTISGTCPLNSYVDLVRDGNFSGVATCTSSQTFSITTDLSPGNNQLQAQDYNITNMPGPTSPPITVDYQPPLAPVNPPNNGGQLVPQTTFEGSNTTGSNVTPSYDNSGHGPLSLTSQYTYNPVQVGQDFGLSLTLSGGTAPYFVSINWGDGQTSNLFFASPQTFSAGHIYLRASNYNVLVEAIDGKGVGVVLQLSANIKNKVSSPAVSSPTKSTPLTTRVITGGGHWLKVLWPAYGIVVLMVISFWLGEREEYQNLMKKRRLRTR